jgi:hypothetical protein
MRPRGVHANLHCKVPSSPAVPAVVRLVGFGGSPPESPVTYLGTATAQGAFGDVNAFVQYLSNFAGWQAAYPACEPRNGDINGDGTYGYLSFGDINPFVALLSGSG